MVHPLLDATEVHWPPVVRGAVLLRL